MEGAGPVDSHLCTGSCRSPRPPLDDIAGVDAIEVPLFPQDKLDGLRATASKLLHRIVTLRRRKLAMMEDAGGAKDDGNR